MLRDLWHLEQRTISRLDLRGAEPASEDEQEFDSVEVMDLMLSSLGLLLSFLISMGRTGRPAACVCNCMKDGGEFMLAIRDSCGNIFCRGMLGFEVCWASVVGEKIVTVRF